MAEPKRIPQPSDSNFDVSDRPSMGDPELVDTMVRGMFAEAKDIIFESPDPQAAVPGLVDKWAKTFSPANAEYIQTLSVDSLNTFLRARGFGKGDPESDTLAPLKALVAEHVGRFVDAAVQFHNEEIDGEQLQFAIDTAAEDFVALVRGLDNPAD